jgi:hypothetical protein
LIPNIAARRVDIVYSSNQPLPSSCRWLSSAIYSSETFLPIYEVTGYHNPEDDVTSDLIYRVFPFSRNIFKLFQNPTLGVSGLAVTKKGPVGTGISHYILTDCS